MRRRYKDFSLVACIAGSIAGIAGNATAAETLPVSHIYFEQNATDGDVEVIVTIKGGDDGLAKLTVVAPDGRTVIDFNAPDKSTLGIREFNFESPEPRNVNQLKAAYPAGVYTFTAATASGAEYFGKSTLTHTPPPTTTVLSPVQDGRTVDIKGTEISWEGVKGIIFYVVGIKQRGSGGVNLSVQLPNNVTSFAVPDGYLLAGQTYQLSIGTIAKNGNTSFVEIDFTTTASE